MISLNTISFFVVGGHEGPPDHVPDGRGGGGAEAAAVSVLHGGAGPDKGYAVRVLRSHERGGERGGASDEQWSGP